MVVINQSRFCLVVHSCFTKFYPRAIVLPWFTYIITFPPIISNYFVIWSNSIAAASLLVAEAATAKYKCFSGTMMNQNDIIWSLKVFHLPLQYLTTILNQQRMSFCKFGNNWNCFSAVVFIYKCFFWFYDKTKVFNRSISKFSICSCVQKIFPWP